MVQIKGIQGNATTLVVTLTSLPSGEGRIATQYDGGTNFPIKGWFSIKTKTGIVVPINGSVLEFYLAYSDAQSSEIITDLMPVVDTDITSLPSNIAPIGALTVTANAGTVFQTVFPVFDLPRKWSLIVWNQLNDSLSSTADDHVVKFIPQYDQTV